MLFVVVIFFKLKAISFPVVFVFGGAYGIAFFITMFYKPSKSLYKAF